MNSGPYVKSDLMCIEGSGNELGALAFSERWLEPGLLQHRVDAETPPDPGLGVEHPGLGHEPGSGGLGG